MHITFTCVSGKIHFPARPGSRNMSTFHTFIYGFVFVGAESKMKKGKKKKTQ